MYTEEPRLAIHEILTSDQYPQIPSIQVILSVETKDQDQTKKTWWSPQIQISFHKPNDSVTHSKRLGILTATRLLPQLQKKQQKKRRSR